ncbi:hypothetical protein DACRYDRAFT_87680 [Dacryopinax primogenitus]|uniref:Uncharacterized protein n=1 Tax=Dacryopinax primogenitus (strain DJM 731) TaxID=1858805 RepID=M5G710_DACPD|nr:uncharacterized protein DACRYDRAFT_87680 [Dacryopinax primogenitus]EJU04504.1 hypothetical protein DACRYDRAFT_87680 [Dacryopinax primogenitus]
MEVTVARTLQLHRCSMDTCLIQTKSGRMKCKRHTPFQVSPVDYVQENGEWGVTQHNTSLNAWNPSVSRMMRCNHNVKIIMNGEDTKDVTFYIANYTAKKQGKSYNLMGLLPSKLQYHFEDTEQAASQCVMYLMGWGDVYQSHHYVALHCSCIVAELY